MQRQISHLQRYVKEAGGGVGVGSVTSFRVQPLPDFPPICCSTGVPSLLNMINEGG